MEYIQHILAPFDKDTQTQSCIICGEIIHDYREAMFAPNEDGSIPENNGWVEGEHYISNTKSPQYFTTTVNKDDLVFSCNANFK